MRFMY